MFLLLLSFFFCFSCVSSKEYLSLTDTEINGDNITVRHGMTIVVNNPTRYNVSFGQNQNISKNSIGTITLPIDKGTITRGFDIWYEIPLNNNVPLYIRGDHRTIREEISLTINEPQITGNLGTYLVIRNNADNAITFNTASTISPLIEQRGTLGRENIIAPTNNREFSPGETAVFDISLHSGFENNSIQDSRRNIPFSLPHPLRRNYLYIFEYSAAGITLTDMRPLHRIGEPGWVKPMPCRHGNGCCERFAAEAFAPMPIIASNGEIHLFEPTQNGLIRHVFGSAGNVKNQVNSGDGFYATFAAPAGNGFFIAGYQTDHARLINIPIARIHDANGTVQRLLPHNDFLSAFFHTAAYKEGAWLVAGGALGVNQVGRFPAYARLLRDNGSALTVGWELGMADFNEALNINPQTPLSVARCGEVLCAVYDPGRSCWLLSGKNIEYVNRQPVTGSYLAIVSDDGKILSIDTSFKGMTFNKGSPPQSSGVF